MAHTPTYHLLALDVDGTTLDSHKRVTPGVRAAVAGLAARGVPVTWCTGRNLLEVEGPHEALPEVRYGVLANGALVYDFGEGRTVCETPIPADSLLEAIEAAHAMGATVHLMTADGSFMDQDILDHPDLYYMGPYHEMHARTATAADVSAFVRVHPAATLKVNLYHRDIATREATLGRLRGSGLTMTYSEVTSLECTADGVSKGRGLGQLAAHLGIPMSQVVSVGDGPNDRPALEVAGLAVAMGSAPDDVKALCGLVVADSDHDGVAEAIARAFPESAPK